MQFSIEYFGIILGMAVIIHLLRANLEEQRRNHPEIITKEEVPPATVPDPPRKAYHKYDIITCIDPTIAGLTFNKNYYVQADSFFENGQEYVTVESNDFGELNLHFRVNVFKINRN
jgi:hypothetical protein